LAALADVVAYLTNEQCVPIEVTPKFN